MPGEAAVYAGWDALQETMSSRSIQSREDLSEWIHNQRFVQPRWGAHFCVRAQERILNGAVTRDVTESEAHHHDDLAEGKSSGATSQDGRGLQSPSMSDGSSSGPRERHHFSGHAKEASAGLGCTIASGGPQFRARSASPFGQEDVSCEPQKCTTRIFPRSRRVDV